MTTASTQAVQTRQNSPATSDPTISFVGKAIHFVGIGGCGLSGLAKMLKEQGAICSGSDCTPSDLTKAMQAQGITISKKQTAKSLPTNCDLVIASAAIEPEHPELVSANQRGIQVLTYAQALGMAQTTHTGVSIAGTHGKSTTAAMLCHALLECDLDPGFIIGANCQQIGGGSRCGSQTVPRDGPNAGKPDLLIAEACEFNRSFHHHRPVMGLINNLEEDHLDTYGNLQAIIEAFADFAKLLPPAKQGGRLLISHNDAHREQVTNNLDCEVKTFGFSLNADYHINFQPETCKVEVREQGTVVASWFNKTMPGEHNALNSAAAAILANILGGEWEVIANALGNFQGVTRRMQRLGERKTDNDGKVIVYDDYGHHPTEIDATLQALKATEHPKRLICVFQPHQHSRTRFLLEDFAKSFSSADIVIVPHIYFVRDSEIEKHKVRASDLVDRLRKRGVAAMHLYPFDAIVEQLQVICRDVDLVVIMGAGPVWQVARDFLKD